MQCVAKIEVTFYNITNGKRKQCAGIKIKFEANMYSNYIIFRSGYLRYTEGVVLQSVDI